MVDPGDTEAWNNWILSFELDRGDVVSADHFRLVDQGCMCTRAGNLAQARVFFDQAREWSAHEHFPDARRVQGEATVYLGDLEYLRGDGACQRRYEQARFLFEALSPHNLGVVSHRLATWHEQNGRATDAWREYNLALTLWRELAREQGRLGNKKRYQKFLEQIGQLESQIDSIMAQVGANPAAGAESPRPDAPIVPTPEATPSASRRVWDLRESLVSVIPIYADLAAGSGLWMSDDGEIQDFAEVDHLLIESKRYKLVNLLDRNSNIRLSRGYLYGLAKVVGNSMDLAGIEDGDFVLFRKSRDVPYMKTNGDIVAATIIRNGQRYGTVKRYRGNPLPGSLEPESTGQHDSIPFNSNEIDPIGQVIAVLKPVR